MQERVRGGVLWIDEAGLLGTRTTNDVFQLAKAVDARVILSGDRCQHGSVERGAALRLLETEAGVVPAEIKEIQRQSAEYKQAVLALSEGRTEDGFRQLDDLKWIREIGDDERYKLMAADYVDAVTSGKTALCVSPTHAEGEKISREIRSELRAAGQLAGEERVLDVLEPTQWTEAQRRDPANYADGQTLVFHQNAKGYRRGQRVAVERGSVPVDRADRFDVFRPGRLAVAAGDVLRVTRNGTTADGTRFYNNDLVTVRGFTRRGDLVVGDNGRVIPKDFGHLAHGYVVTSHASQGKSVKKVFIGQSAESFGASSREQFYVSVSRGKEIATVYTDSKTDLLEAVERSDERLSATELLSAGKQRQRAVLIASRPNSAPGQEAPNHDRRREEVALER